MLREKSVLFMSILCIGIEDACRQLFIFTEFCNVLQGINSCIITTVLTRTNGNKVNTSFSSSVYDIFPPLYIYMEFVS